MPSSPATTGPLDVFSKSQVSCAGLLTESAVSVPDGKKRGRSSALARVAVESGLPCVVTRRLVHEVRETTSPVRAISRLMPVVVREVVSRAAKSQASSGRQAAKAPMREVETCPFAVSAAGTSPISAAEANRHVGAEGSTISSTHVKMAAPCLVAAQTSRVHLIVAGIWCLASITA